MYRKEFERLAVELIEVACQDRDHNIEVLPCIPIVLDVVIFGPYSH